MKDKRTKGKKKSEITCASLPAFPCACKPQTVLGTKGERPYGLEVGGKNEFSDSHGNIVGAVVVTKKEKSRCPDKAGI